jgi:hypothetical protein
MDRLAYLCNKYACWLNIKHTSGINGLNTLVKQHQKLSFGAVFLDFNKIVLPTSVLHS